MSVPIGCSGRDGHCQSLAAKVEGDRIVIVHVHRGERHETAIMVTDLLRLTEKPRILVST